MHFHEGVGGLGFFFDHEFGDVRLRPEERERASDLSIGVDLGGATFIPDHDLFTLDEVCDIATFVDATMEESCATAFSATPGDQDYIELILDRLPVNKALHQVSEPDSVDALRLYLLEHVPVP